MIQPLADVFSFFLALLNAMPYAVQSFFMLSISLAGLGAFIQLLLHLRN